MLKDDIQEIAARAAAVQRTLQALRGHAKRELLYAVSDALEARHDAIFEANEADCAEAQTRGRPEAQIARIAVSEDRFTKLLRMVRMIADVADPIGEKLSRWVRPNGLEISRVRVPLGVVGLCCESRPAVLPITAAACLKVNNVLICVSDTDARRTQRAFLEAIHCGLQTQAPNLSTDAVQLYNTEEAQVACRVLTNLSGTVDIAILRGSQSFVKDLVEHASIPVLKRLGRLCHVYVDRDCPNEDTGRGVYATDLPCAVDVCMDSRCFNPSTCSAASVVLVHQDIMNRFLPMLSAAAAKNGVTLKADERALKFLPEAQPAEPADFLQATSSLTLSVGIVDSLEAAITQINQNGSRLSDAIVTGSPDSERDFLSWVDSAAVYANASTVFTSGPEFGMGEDVGISTDKLLPRGPIGLEGLTSVKYVARGDGQTRGNL